MIFSPFRYFGPKSSQLDRTVVSVQQENDLAFPTSPQPEHRIANEQTTNSNQRTKNQFRPRAGKGGATSYQLRQYAEVTLGGGSLRKVVKLPEGEDENEWLAVNSRYLFGSLSLSCQLKIERCFDLDPDFLSQWSISTTKSTCCTGQLLNSALHNHVPK